MTNLDVSTFQISTFSTPFTAGVHSHHPFWSTRSIYLFMAVCSKLVKIVEILESSNSMYDRCRFTWLKNAFRGGEGKEVALVQCAGTGTVALVEPSPPLPHVLLHGAMGWWDKIEPTTGAVREDGKTNTSFFTPSPCDLAPVSVQFTASHRLTVL